MSSEKTSAESVHPPSDNILFTLRLWNVTTRGGQSEWRGRLQLVRTGQVRYFRDWDTLIAYLSEMLFYIHGRSR